MKTNAFYSTVGVNPEFKRTPEELASMALAIASNYKLIEIRPITEVAGIKFEDHCIHLYRDLSTLIDYAIHVDHLEVVGISMEPVIGSRA